MNDYLSVAEVAKLKDVTTKTVYEWIKRGLRTEKEQVSGLKFRQVIRAKHLEDFIEEVSNG